MSKIDINNENIKNISSFKLEDTIDKLRVIRNNVEDLDVPNGFSYNSYLKETATNIDKIINNLNKSNEELNDILNRINIIDNNMCFEIYKFNEK